jgi:hypothetical protein
MTWAEFLHALDMLDLSQAQFARLTGTRPQVVSRWGHAKRGAPYWVRSWLRMFGGHKLPG